jgi:vanillate O-demethylase monooxygenase subunit
MNYLKNTWYVAAWSHEVTDRLFPRRILGEEIVIYRRRNGSPAALEDECPHRFAPLHLGSIQGDNVECGYHGLQFSASGNCVVNPHGEGTIPKACSVRHYPIVEKHGALWIWPGDPEMADPETIPDFAYVTATENKTVYGGTLLKANYELISDNLMDASHTQFVHKDLLGTDAFSRSKHEVIQEGSIVNSNYIMPNGKVPPAYKDYFDENVGPVDYSVNFRWHPPALVRNVVLVTPVGRTKEEGVIRIGTHLMTPETETTTHYFFAHTRNFSLDDLRVDERIRRWQKLGLTEQDGTMIEAVQKKMGTADLDSLRPVMFSIDTAAVRVRRVLANLIRQEQEKTIER